MKVIETTFRGCRYRSRLEARWAVFMHALKVPYVYEPEAYDLDDGVYYLPDFWLPDQDCFLEIKPYQPKEEETLKAEKLAIFTGKQVMVCFGPVEVPDFGKGAGDSMIEISSPNHGLTEDTNSFLRRTPKSAAGIRLIFGASARVASA